VENIRVLKEVSFSVGKGKSLGMLGPNGSGKTTLCKSIMGVVKPTKGYILFGKKEITKLPPHERGKIGISMVPERIGIFPKSSVEDNLIIGAVSRLAQDNVKDMLEFIYEKIPILKEKRSLPAECLSGGQRQMLSLGRALMNKPKLLILDEPSQGLSALYIKKLRDLLQQIKKEMSLTLIVAEQSPIHIKDLCDEFLVLVAGQVSGFYQATDVNLSTIWQRYIEG
jgi:branched-chain amino acid transport system ATP-binding protein